MLKKDRDRSRGRGKAFAFVHLLLAMMLAMAGGCARQRGGGPAAVREAPLTAEQKQRNVESFDYVWNTIRDKHWDPDLGGLDWAAVRDELRPQVEAATTTAEARAVMNRMLRRLEQSHFAIIPASVYADVDRSGSSGRDGGRTSDDAASKRASGNSPGGSKQGSDRDSGDGVIGAEVRVIGDKAVITRVHPDLPADKGGVRPGWELVAIDKHKVEPAIARLRQRLPQNNMPPTMLSASVASRLEGSVGESSNFRFRDGRGKIVRKTIARVPPPGTRADFGNLPPFYVTFDSRRLPPNTGYIAFSAFFDPVTVMKKFSEAMREYKDADGIILDLRGNPGGLGAMAMGIGNWFVLRPDQRLGTMQMRSGPLNFVLNPRADVYQGPLAVLVDEMSMSTSEILAGGLQDIGRAKVFGTRTPGAALPSIVEMLPNGDGFQYAFANYVSASGKTLEGSGVTPDYPVTADPAALLAGRDPVIDAAQAWIQTQ